MRWPAEQEPHAAPLAWASLGAAAGRSGPADRAGPELTAFPRRVITLRRGQVLARTLRPQIDLAFAGEEQALPRIDADAGVASLLKRAAVLGGVEGDFLLAAVLADLHVSQL